MHIATKLNRTHALSTAKSSYLLPCLGRIEIDMQASGPQVVSMEDSTACIHASRCARTPASQHLLSEPEIIAGMAKATLPPNPKMDWDKWVDDYSRIRDAIEATYPDHVPRTSTSACSRSPAAFPSAGGTRTQMEDRDRQGQFHHAEIA